MRPRVGVAVVTALSSLLLAAGAHAATITVTTHADAGAGSLRQAILDAAPGATIAVPADTYTLTSAELAIAKPLTIAGHDAADTIVRAAGGFRVFHTSGAGNAITISGLTIRDGNPAISGSQTLGGGVLNEGATLTLSHVTVTNNVANADGAPGVSGHVADGGGIDSSSGSLAVLDSTVTGNVASAVGGTAKSGGVASGGGIESDGGLTLQRSTISGNRADARGGQGTADTNQSGGIAEGGGLVVLGPADSTVSSSTISANTADASAGPGANGGIGDGGGTFAVSNGPTFTATNVTLTQNAALALAGGAGVGGGIASGGGMNWGANTPGHIVLVNLTLSSNATDTSGGNPGISSGGDGYLGGANTSVVNTVVTGGTSAGGSPTAAQNCGGTPASLGHNIDSRDECSFHAAGDRVNTDPQLGPLAGNGGPVQTQAIPFASPALNGGDNANCPATDARGVARPQGVACDVGAFELELADVSTSHAPAPQPLVVGRNLLAFTVAVRNAGTATARGATMTDTLPAGTTLVSATPSAGSCAGAPVVTCTLGDVAAGTTATVQLVVRPSAPGALHNAATATSSTVDPDTSNNASSASSTDVPLTLAGLKVSPASFRVGSQLPALTKGTPTATTIAFTLPEAARAVLRFTQLADGRRVGRRCVATTRRNRRRAHCTRLVSRGQLALAAHPGLNHVRFSGRLSRRSVLPVGAYRLTAVASDAAGDVSPAVTARFRVLATPVKKHRRPPRRPKPPRRPRH